jgi:hypothetical protein
MTLGKLAACTLLVVSVAVLSACSRQRPAPATVPAPQAHPQDEAQAAWTAFAAQFIEDTFKAQPFFASQSGRHEFDGQMPDWSAAGIAKEVTRLVSARKQAQAFNPAALTPSQRFERQYIVSVTTSQLFWLDQAKAPFVNPAWYVDRLDPEVYLSRDYAPLPTRMQAYIGYARQIPRLVADIRANLRTPMAKTLVERGIEGFGGFATFYRNDVPKVFASIQDAQAQKQLAEADAAAARAMDGLKQWLQSQRKSATDHFALGEALFADMLLSTEQVDTPVAQLQKIGQADLDRNLAALKEACAQYLPKGSLRACTLKMESDKPKGGPSRRHGGNSLRSRPSSSRRTSRRSRVRRRRWWPRRRRTIAATPPTSTCPGRMTRGWLRPTTSRPPIRTGRRRSRRPTFPVRTICCIRVSMRCGPDTFCSSCMLIATLPGLPRYGWATGTPKGGRITRKR